jgi:hypothetical protein
MELPKPRMEIFCDRPWVSLGGDRQRYARSPRDDH